MWPVLAAHLLVLSMSAVSNPAQPAAASVPTQATRQTVFSIPFRISRPADPAQEPVEVQLYVSANGGQSWELAAKVPPARGHFVFQARGDGQYWFLVRTLDRSGRLHPQNVSAPGLRVIVDTSPPQLDVKAERGAAGQVIARWRIQEPFPKPQTLKIQFRMREDRTWQTVALDRQAVGGNGWQPTGEVAWWPPSQTGNLEVRAELTDQAGNMAVTHAQLELAGPATSGQAAGSAGNGPAAPMTPVWRSGEQIAPAPPPRLASVDGPLQSSYRRQFNAKPEEAAGPQLQAATTSKPLLREEPRMVNSRLFELEYDVESLGSAKLDQVELWATQDGGQTWQSFGLDDDKCSPMPVNVPGEGLYGFRIVARNTLGFGQSPPQSGDPPDLLIRVDLAQPVAKIVSTIQGTGEQSNQLAIRWEAADPYLEDRPVSLLFSTNPDGPWSTIAAGLENTGQYTWTFDSRTPRQILVVLEVRDKAGNVGRFATRDPIAITSPGPSARIRSIRPRSDAAQQPAQPPRF